MKTYNQFCGLAFALDVVGERWTLLIIRELLAGPRRFKDLIDGLPGVSTNLLSERLKELEQHGVLTRRTLPPPAGSTVYELTPFGQAIEKAVLELGTWGSRLFPPSMEGVNLPSVGAMTLAIKAFFHEEAARDISETYELHLNNEVLQVQVDNGRLSVQTGQTFKPDAVFYTDMQVFVGLFAGQIPPDDAIAGGLIRVEGDAGALRRFLSVSSVPG
jgi:DNA-binding HxlR family transcriptional regulator/putative sterol carrier protein